MIPKRLHYVWVGSKLPAKQRDFIDSWRATNPDYEIVCWNEDNIDL
jgi:mannosyltransferase OCH1-like enzyme